jgi:ankyrin repeat protein
MSNDGLAPAHATNQLEIVKYLFQPGVTDPNKGLYKASIVDETDVVEFLLANGADINYINAINGQTALHNAADFGYLSLTQFLVKNNAEIDLKSSDGGMTALQYASQYNHLPIVKLLIENNASLDETDNVGQTALQMAAVRGNFEVVQFLVEKGANITSVDKDGLNALQVAENEKIASYLINHGASYISVPQALQYAITNYNHATVKYLLENYANINEKLDEGKTPLHLTVQLGDVDNTNYLLANNADVKAKDDLGKTPLHYAAAFEVYGSLEIAAAILKKKPESEAKVNIWTLLC